jgi:ribosomal protein L11 methylase PrmA
LLDIVENIVNLTQPNGKVILSGLLASDREDIVKLYTKNGLVLVDENLLGEWIALVFNKG